MKDEELKKYAFCENCLDDVEYEIKYDIPMSGVIKGVEYHYLGIEAYCKKCGALVFTPETNDYNLESLYNVYRKENDIVSLSVIRDIPQKYNIGKRPLSLLLGWGELTFSRYYDGDIPSKQYSEILKRIYAEPSYYSELLEAGKDKLKSSLAYKKSREATDALLDIKIDRRITLAVKYLIYKCEDITALALQKALYYSQGIYCAFFDNFMFSEDCEAWAHGPVYRDIYNIYKDYKFNPITPDSSFDITVLNERERTILDVVAEYFCCYSGKTLENFTHHEEPWIEARCGNLDFSYSDEIIPKKDIRAYFVKIKERYNMSTPKDFQLYALDMFKITSNHS